MKRKVLGLFLTIFVFMTSVINANAVSKTVTFNYRDLNSKVNIQSGASSKYKTIKSGSSTIVGFCLNKSLKVPESGTTLTYKSTITDAGYLYIFKNGYSGTWNKTLLGTGLTNDQKYYATQLAIWLYQGKITTSSLDQSDPEAEAAVTLYKAAKKAKTTKNSIDIKSSDTTMFSDDTYYKSTLMTVSGSGYEKFKVTLTNAPSSARIITTTGKTYKSGNSLTEGTSFYVRIPKSKVTDDMKITVKVTAEVEVSEVYKYTSNNSAYQDIGVLVSTKEDISDSLKIKLVEDENETFTVKIYKKDAVTEKNLSGAKLVLKNSDGDVIDTWTSTTSARTIKNLEPGVYSVTETKAPSGYVLNKKAVKFTLVSGGAEEKTVYIYNTPEEAATGTVKVSKKDITTGKNLSGATLVIKDANGDVVEKWVSTKSAHYVRDLPAGKYTLIETKSPKGYGLSDEIIRFTIDEDGNPSDETIIMYNSPIPVTADINLTLIFMGFVGTISLGVFSIYKLVKQQ